MYFIIELLDHMAALYHLRNYQSAFQSDRMFHIPTCMCMRMVFSASLLVFITAHLFILAVLIFEVWICISLRNNGVEHLHVLIDYLYVVFGVMTSNSLSIFKLAYLFIVEL